MSVTEASQQANRAEMDPRRLVVVSYLVFGLIMTLFLGRLVELVMGQVEHRQRGDHLGHRHQAGRPAWASC